MHTGFHAHNQSHPEIQSILNQMQPANICTPEEVHWPLCHHQCSSDIKLIWNTLSLVVVFVVLCCSCGGLLFCGACGVPGCVWVLRVLCRLECPRAGAAVSPGKSVIPKFGGVACIGACSHAGTSAAGTRSEYPDGTVRFMTPGGAIEDVPLSDGG